MGTATPPYTLQDMANDAAGLLDALGIKKVHVCGRSMGGMIAQEFALSHTDRTLSLTSIYSTTGNPDLPQAKPEAMQAVMEPAPEEREAYRSMSPKNLAAEMTKLENEMYEHASNLEFEEAALIRDKLEEVKRLALGPE